MIAKWNDKIKWWHEMIMKIADKYVNINWVKMEH